MAATRTWVSGVGDDANPGSRTAPCKTFAGAISKTAPAGEISVLDPGGFGAVTITKGITLNGDGTLAGVLAVGTNGIVIQAGASDVVILRNLSIGGAGGGLSAIRFLAGAALIVENCSIYGFLNNGIDVALGGNGSVFVQKTTITNCAGNGINVTTSAGQALVTVDDVRVEKCGIGMRFGSGARAMVRNCVVCGSANGIRAEQTLTDNPLANVIGCHISNNTGAGVQAGPGAPVMRISSNVVMLNGTGLSVVGGSQIISLSNNMVSENSTDGNPTSTELPK